MKNKTMYAVCYAMAPRVQVLDEWFDDEDEALDAALEAIEIGVQYDTTGDYDPDVEMAHRLGHSRGAPAWMTVRHALPTRPGGQGRADRHDVETRRVL